MYFTFYNLFSILKRNILYDDTAVFAGKDNVQYVVKQSLFQRKIYWNNSLSKVLGISIYSNKR